MTLKEGKQWPWSKRHPWQSWRDRYKKNQDEFDYKIKQRIKKLKEREERGGEEGESAMQSDQVEEKKEVPPTKPVTKAARKLTTSATFSEVPCWTKSNNAREKVLHVHVRG